MRAKNTSIPNQFFSPGNTYDEEQQGTLHQKVELVAIMLLGAKKSSLRNLKSFRLNDIIHVSHWLSSIGGGGPLFATQN